MFLRRGLSPFSFAVGFVSGILFALIVIVGHVCKYPDSSTEIVTRRSHEKEVDSVRKDVATQSAANVSVDEINDNIAGCELFQRDVTRVAWRLHQQVRVLCWVMTSPTSLETRARHVRETWGRRCNVLLFANDYKEDRYPTMDINVTKGREHLVMKTMKAFDYVYAHHRNDADWFLKTDDDTYVIMENLRHLLAPHNPQDALSFGHQLIGAGKGFFSGGAGYVISREALNRFAHRAPRSCANDGPGEDVAFANCIHSLNVKAGDSRDAYGRHRFHVFRLASHLHGSCPVWYYRHSKHNDKEGPYSVSDYPVSFHYVTGQRMLELDYLVYRMHVYGIVGGLQSVNPATAPSNGKTQ